MLALVIGGAGSGKSAWAEQLTKRLAGQSPRYYLATMQVWDKECEARVLRHRRQRAGGGYQTLEQPRDLAAIAPQDLVAGSTILLEDLGNLTANELYALGADAASAQKAVWEGIRHLTAHCRHLVIVSNEVGTGGSDYAGETDLYLRVLGRLHRKLAREADAVWEVVAGVPVCYKGREWI